MREVAAVMERTAALGNIKVYISMTHNFSAFGGHSFNVSRTPIVFINDQIEFAGVIPNPILLQKKLFALRDQGSFVF